MKTGRSSETLLKPRGSTDQSALEESCCWPLDGSIGLDLPAAPEAVRADLRSVKQDEKSSGYPADG